MKFILDHICLKQKKGPAKKLQTWSALDNIFLSPSPKASKNTPRCQNLLFFPGRYHKPSRFHTFPAIVAQTGEKHPPAPGISGSGYTRPSKFSRRKQSFPSPAKTSSYTFVIDRFCLTINQNERANMVRLSAHGLRHDSSRTRFAMSRTPD